MMETAFVLDSQWALIGDHSRYRFAGWLLGHPCKEAYTGKRIWISQRKKSSEADVATQHVDEIHLYSPYVPPGMCICILPDGEEQDAEHLAKFPFVLLFEGFPWKKEATDDWVKEKWQRMSTHSVLALVLMKEEHRAGATDLDRIEDVMREARSYYEEQGLSVYLPQASDFTEVFSLHASLIDTQRERLREKLSLLEYRIEDLPHDYEELLLTHGKLKDSLSLDVQKKICHSYDSARKTPEDCLWATWNRIALVLLFAKGTGYLHSVPELYGTILRDVEIPRIADWDVPKMCEQLGSTLKREFKEYMQVPAQYATPVSWHTIENQTAYEELLYKSAGVPVIYWKKYQEFVKERVPMVLKEQLTQYYMAWKELIS